MTDTGPAVALLFDDTDLGGQLREALQERGARIVHEGGVSSLSRDLLQQTMAEVLVVNLDDSADDALDQLYEVIDGDHPRVVFNDAQASRSLQGWDRARWARHLAVKVLAMGDIDPPRPSGAQAIEPRIAMAAAEPEREPAVPDTDVSVDEAPAQSGEPELPDENAVAEPDPEMEPDFLADDALDESPEFNTSAESESLAAELEALLASGELPEEDAVDAGPGLRFVDGEEPPALNDGDFLGSDVVKAPESDAEPDLGEPVELDEPLQFDEPVMPWEQPAAAAAEPDGDDPFGADQFTLSEPSALGETGKSDEKTPAVSAPDGWALVEDGEPASVPSEKPDPADFGIEKVSAADFLAPDIDAVDDELQPKMTLELMSMEEAVAPQQYVHDHEMVLDELGSVLSRVIVLGAATDGIDSVCAFLAEMPATTRLTFLLTQHLGKQSDASLVAEFAANCALPVRLARGDRAAQGEVLVVPAGQKVHLRRDGTIELQPLDAGEEQEPSIDASLTMAAGVFGRDALAIVFAGHGNDAVAGAQAIHDRGGQVWVEASSGDHFGDMVSGIFAERLVGFSGTPPELAARLLEVFP